MISFMDLRQANLWRLPEFKNKYGDPAHTKEDGSDWTPSQWLEALVGEVGEYANWHKKYMRSDISKHEFEIEAKKELADIQIYLDLLALRCLDEPGKPDRHGINLGQATIDKFNEVSKRVGSTVSLIPRIGAFRLPK